MKFTKRVKTKGELKIMRDNIVDEYERQYCNNWFAHRDQ